MFRECEVALRHFVEGLSLRRAEQHGLPVLELDVTVVRVVVVRVVVGAKEVSPERSRPRGCRFSAAPPLLPLLLLPWASLACRSLAAAARCSSLIFQRVPARARTCRCS